MNAGTVRSLKGIILPYMGTPIAQTAQEQQGNISNVDFRDCDTLHVGSLHPLATESHLLEKCSPLQTATEASVIKDRLTGLSVGYGFVKFINHR